jgi:succinyl-CoA synthetase alpha subunit
VLNILNKAGIGVSVAVGIGDDPIIGMDFKFCLELLESDPHTEQIVLVGGPGGDSELIAATYIMENMTKPVVAYVVGETLAVSMMRPFISRNTKFFQNSVERKAKAFIDAGALLARKIEDIPCLLKR